MKKLLTLLLAALLVVTCCFSLIGCGEKEPEGSTIKAGLICIHGDTSTYDKNFIQSFKAACEAKNIQYIIKTEIPEGQECYNAAIDLIDQGCNYIFADSFGHEAHVIKAAEENPSVQFGHATGTHAHTAGVSNFHNAFASIYEGRYLAGYAAGLKLLTMTNKADQNNNFKVGYVGAWQYAEVISGYTSWFLGVRAALAEAEGETRYTATMEVSFTKSWYDFTGEQTTANTLISNGCVIISQHADSMGAPGACELANVPNVTYNGSTVDDCPNTYLIASKINWTPYFTYCFNCMENGESIATDYAFGLDANDFSKGSVCLENCGSAAAPNTMTKLSEIRSELLAGTRRVFDCSKFTVKGQNLTSYLADVDDYGDYQSDTEVIKTVGEITFFDESTFRSAPYFDLTIDGIELLNSGF